MHLFRRRTSYLLALSSLMLMSSCGGGSGDSGGGDSSAEDSQTASGSEDNDSTTETGQSSETEQSSGDGSQDPSGSDQDTTSETSDSEASTGESSTDDDSTATSSTGDTTDEGGDFDDGELVEGIALTGVEFNQGSAIVVAKDGEPVALEARDNELVAGRHALVRAIYTLDGFAGGDVEGRLLLSYADGTQEILKQPFNITGDSDLTKLGGTIEWRLEPEQMKAGMSYAMGIFVPGSPEPRPLAATARLPSTGTQELGVPDRLMRIEIVIVKTDSSLDYSDANLALMADVFYEHSPLQFGEVNITVREEAVDGGGSLDSCLQAVKQTRAADNPDPHVYYLGLMSGQIGGLSDLSGPTMQDAARRSSCNYNGTGGEWPWDANQIAVHEVGHAAGSPHTPGCNAAGAVDDYPDLDSEGKARLGVWGYSVSQDKLYEPNSFGDLMCYCRPHWTGRYTYGKWTERIAILSSWPQFYGERDRFANRQEILWGIRGPNQISWWIAPDVLPAMPESVDVEVSYGDAIANRRTLATTFVDNLADPEYQLIAVPLGQDVSALHDFSIDAFGQHFDFTSAHELRQGYERVAQGVK